jgi:ribosomal protein S12 methylthiotransferase accessory factor
MKMKISFPGGSKVFIKYKDFIIKTDQPIKYGGDNSHPDPFSIFISSIGACIGYYILSFCQERKISTEGIQLDLDTKNNDSMIEQISIKIKTKENFPEKYKKSMIRVANLCKVKKHIEKPPRIDISFN